MAGREGALGHRDKGGVEAVGVVPQATPCQRFHGAGARLGPALECIHSHLLRLYCVETVSCSNANALQEAALVAGDHLKHRFGVPRNGVPRSSHVAPPRGPLPCCHPPPPRRQCVRCAPSPPVASPRPACTRAAFLNDACAGRLPRPPPPDFTGTSVSQCSISTYQANKELEDRHFVVPSLKLGSKTGTVLGVMDGHGGWQTAEFTKANLPGILGEEVAQCTAAAGEQHAAQVWRCCVPVPVRVALWRPRCRGVFLRVSFGCMCARPRWCVSVCECLCAGG